MAENKGEWTPVAAGGGGVTALVFGASGETGKEVLKAMLDR